jgi:type IV secretion system protein VirD4
MNARACCPLPCLSWVSTAIRWSSDISRTKPLIRLVLNQIGRRLTEDLHAKDNRQRLLLMLDEFPALGRLDFFESALAFMAGYGIKAFLIAQSLNQIEKAYGQNNSILDNCHVRVSFATNDERTAKRVSDALGTATEMRAMKNYAGHRLSPWLGHLMVSRSETARALLTPGEIMQLPPDDEIVMVAGVQPIRAKKARYYQDRRMTARLQPPPKATPDAKQPRPDDWSGLPLIEAPVVVLPVEKTKAAPKDGTKKTRKNAKGKIQDDDAANADIRREPMIEPYVDIAPPLPPAPANEFDLDEADPATDAARIHRAVQDQAMNARRASLDPDDGLEI